MKRNNPTLTHTEIYAYAIQYVKNKYDEDMKNANLADENGDHLLADMIRNQSPWRGKLIPLCQLYEMETGVPHEFMPE